MKKIMIAGATGVLGKLVCHEIIRLFETQTTLIVTDYKSERGKQFAASFDPPVQFRYLDVRDKESIEQTVSDVDLVIVMLKQDRPEIQAVCIKQQILSIDVTPFYQFVSQAKQLDQLAKSHHTGAVMMAGFFPGLSGLMVKAAKASFDQTKRVDVGLLQNTNANVGISGILDMLQIISAPVDQQAGFTKKRSMYFQTFTQEKEVRQIDHAEQKLLDQYWPGLSLHYWTAWNSVGFNRLVSLIKRMGGISLLHQSDPRFLTKLVKHNPDKDEHAVLTIEVQGVIDGEEKTRQLSLLAFSDYHITAAMTAALAKIIMNQNIEGVVAPFEITSLPEVLQVMNIADIPLEDHYL
ncbi:saccharopine dehydrogenase NADP-binding domain-containing protein [Gracilibacillus alcaliphilus]|uniref:saccharopine dehydrogenase NADP-binding domain-containing protein n=1 Tax=Gracilibacillus alcaliphilus TaxID=1401441 RepID=UPI001957C82E|nr:saccharopine dehydrogenase NADP-binding domain-containing protein [Gracilibacillus alcaliphilus]MBM7676577.1 saccharopine dehydrogenase-like NADP-dependent oxidoreductase [Gracilibacillus alcaliphilus]